MPRARLTLGTAQLGMPYGVANRHGLPSPAEVDAILDTALDLGVRSIDTAPVYGDAEIRIGAWLARRGRPQDLEIGTKLPPLGASGPGELQAVVAAAVDGSLRRLGVDRLDGYLVHRVADLRRHGAALVEALANERERGRIGRIGVSVYDPEDVSLALDHAEITAVQHPLNLLDRRMLSSGRLRELASRKIVTYARSAWLQGLLALSSDALPARVAHARPALSALEGLLAEFEMTPLDVALAFVASTVGIDHVVVGAETAEQVRASVSALDRPVPPGLLEALDARFPEALLAVVDPTRWPVGAS